MKRREKSAVTIVGIILVVGLLSPLILTWYWHFYWEADSKIEAVLPAPPACFVPAGVMVDGVARASVQAWVDLNGDGTKASDEPPLRYVVVMIARDGYAYDARKSPISWDQIKSMQYDIHEWLQVTNKSGDASISDFRAGCPCNCWKGSSVAAWGPAGYEATTPTLIALSKDDEAVTFGFRLVNP